MFSGEAGIGKSRLLGELAVDLAGHGVVVLGGRCDDSIHAPYGPLLEALRPQLREDLVASHLTAVGPDAGHLALVLPELASIVTPPPPDADPGASRARLLDALEALIASLAGEDAPGRAVRRRPPVRRPFDARCAAARAAIGSRRGLPARRRLPRHRRHRGPPAPAFFEDLHRDRLLLRTELTGLDPDSLGALVTDVAGTRPPPDQLLASSARPAATRSSSRRCSATRASRD